MTQDQNPCLQTQPHSTGVYLLLLAKRSGLERGIKNLLQASIGEAPSKFRACSGKSLWPRPKALGNRNQTNALITPASALWSLALHS